MLPEPTTATGTRGGVGHVTTSEMRPSRSNEASNRSPARIGTEAWSAPVMITAPAAIVTPSATERVRGPRDRPDGVAEGGRAGSAGDDLAVALEDAPDEPRVEPVDRDDRLAHEDMGRRGEVRDGVGQADLPVGDPGVDDLDGGGDAGGRRQHVVATDRAARAPRGG